jgi:hypothetical protein
LKTLNKTKVSKFFVNFDFIFNQVYHNLRRNQIIKVLDFYETGDMTECETIGMAILTHGESDGILLVHDRTMHVTEFVDPIKRNITLLSKPKVYFSILCV